MKEPKRTIEPGKLADQTAERVVDLLGKYPPVRKIRNSQLISAILGVVGFALFVAGIDKLFAKLSDWVSILMGLGIMAVSGLLLQKLSRKIYTC